MVEIPVALSRMLRYLRIAGLSLTALFFFCIPPTEAIDREEVIEQMKKNRPANLVVLIKRPDVGGDFLLGLYALKKDKSDPDLRRFKLWKEWPYDLNVHTESVRCNPEEPLRVTRDGRAIYVRRLNPGGVVTPVNREDHLVWWAACVPELGGTDPATLKDRALSLGYSTVLVESQEVLVEPVR
ncbi:MAG: hypothetical protein AB8A48_08790 [Prochlorococcus sp.]